MSLLQPIVPELATFSDGQRCLLWRCESQRHQLSCVPVGGGLSVVDWVVNLEVDGQYARHDLAVHGRNGAAALPGLSMPPSG